MSLPTYATGKATTIPYTFSSFSNFEVYGTNGLDRGFRWDKVTSSFEDLGMDPVLAAPTLSTGGTGGADGSYQCAYRWLDDTLPSGVPSSLGPVAGVSASAGQCIRWSALQTPPTRAAWVQFLRTTDGQEDVVYPVLSLAHSVSISSIANNGGYVQITAAASHGFLVGDAIFVSGTATSLYNTNSNSYLPMHIVTKVISATVFVTDQGFIATGGASGTAQKIARKFPVSGTFGSVDNSGGFFRLQLSAGHGLSVGSYIYITGTGIGALDSAYHTITAVTTTTATLDEAYTAGTAGGSFAFAGLQSTGDPATDTQISNDWNDPLSILYPDGSPCARRFEPPPNHKPYLAECGDRMFYYGRVLYRTSVTVTTGGVVTGTGFTSAMVGRYMYVEGSTNPFHLSSYTNSTTMSVSNPPTVAISSSTDCQILPPPDEVKRVYWSEAGEPESVPPINAIDAPGMLPESGWETGLMPVNGYLYLLHERAVYRLSYTGCPPCNASIDPVAQRGCVNNRCWALGDGVAYLLDGQGIWKMDDGGVEAISGPIQNYWYDDLMDWNSTSLWHAVYEPREEVVRFFVNLAVQESSSEAPRWAFCYHTKLDMWWLEQFAYPVGASCQSNLDSGGTGLGRVFTVYGATNELLYLANSGRGDGVSGTSYLVSSSTSNTVTISASLSDAHIGAAIGVLDGTGLQQWRRITAVSGTQLTVDANWTTNPSAGDYVATGAILWSLKTGAREFEMRDGEGGRQHRIAYQPTAADMYINIRHFFNHDTAADTQRIDYDNGRGVRCFNGRDDIQVNMNTTKTYGTEPGLAVWEIGGDLQQDGRADIWLTTEYRGIQYGYQVTLYDLETKGAKA